MIYTYSQRSYGESAGRTKADLVLKVFALLMRDVIPSVNNGENEAALLAGGQNDSSFQYEATLRRISALGWSSDLRHLPEMNFIQLYDYLVVSTRKYQHIVLKGTHYKKDSSERQAFTPSWWMGTIWSICMHSKRPEINI